MTWRVSVAPGIICANRMGKPTEHAAQQDRSPNVDVHAGLVADPRLRRNDKGDDDGGDPLKQHQHGKQPVDFGVRLVLTRGEDCFGA